MKIIVLGAGVIGVTTAYYLARQGADVRVIDRQSGPGLETSFANAGELSYGMTSPWAAPGIPLKAIKWLCMRHAPFSIRPSIDPAFWNWGLQLLRNCNADGYRLNKSRMVRISNYSRDVMTDLLSDETLDFDLRQQGTLQVFRTEKQLKASKADQEILAAYNSPFEVLDVEGCVAAEPGLARVRDKIVGGLRMTADRTGDCNMFTVALAARAAALGVTFDYTTSIRSLRIESDRIVAVDTDKGAMQADAFVLALGPHSAAMVRPIGLRLPIYPVKGYSITLPVTNDAAAPQSTLMDETHKVAITRLGNRIRVAGQAALAGYDTTLGARATDTVRHVVSDLFPDGGDITQSVGWTGLRPMTPDGTPILGPTRYSNLWLNTGHGTLGWTMACGSGRALADAILGRTPEMSFEGLTLERYPS